MTKKIASTARAAKPSKKSQPRLYTLEVSLVGGPVTEEFADENPEVSRTIEIRGDQTLEDLHFAIYDAYDRDDEHMYEFQFGKKPMDRKAPRYVMSIAMEDPFGDIDVPSGCVDETTLDSLELAPRRQFFYWFDFGDDWWHKIKVVAIGDELPAGKFPRVTQRIGKSPPQYPDFDEE